MTDIAQVIDHAEQHCKARGARLTHKRKQVLSGLAGSDKALSAYELIDVCQQQYGEELPAMSMYRILDFLRKEHLVHKLDLANKYVACAHITCDHEHAASQFLICDRCHAVKELMLGDSVMSELTASIEQAGFTLASPKFEINCICADCAAVAD